MKTKARISAFWKIPTVLVSVACLCGCSSEAVRRPASHSIKQPTESGQWLDDARMEETIAREERMFGNGKAGPGHAREMRKLQEQSDILLRQVGLDKLQLVRARVPNTFPSEAFLPAEISKYLCTNRPIHLVVTLIPYEGGSPEVIRAADKSLREAGVRRRIYQTFGPTHFLQLDSAAPNVEPTKKGVSH